VKFPKYEWNADMKNVQKLNFCSKNDQITSMSNKPKLKKHPVVAEKNVV
jgi:hypothetical protein